MVYTIASYKYDDTTDAFYKGRRNYLSFRTIMN